MQATTNPRLRRSGRGSAVALAIAVIGAALLASCSSAAGGTVKVTLAEWTVVADPVEVPAGDVKFEVTNAGTKFEHEFVVIKTDLAPDALPADAAGKVDEESSDLNFIGEIEGMAIGASESGSFKLDAGKYVLICNIVETGAGKESHYNQGMRTAFTVK
jgi:uncharacterized cupredoxin-like copper-binding protein